MTFTTISDLAAEINDLLTSMGVDAEREELLESIRAHRAVRYEDHDEAAVEELLRAVWADLTDGAEWPE